MWWNSISYVEPHTIHVKLSFSATPFFQFWYNPLLRNLLIIDVLLSSSPNSFISLICLSFPRQDVLNPDLSFPARTETFCPQLYSHTQYVFFFSFDFASSKYKAVKLPNSLPVKSSLVCPPCPPVHLRHCIIWFGFWVI